MKFLGSVHDLYRGWLKGDQEVHFREKATEYLIHHLPSKEEIELDLIEESCFVDVELSKAKSRLDALSHRLRRLEDLMDPRSGEEEEVSIHIGQLRGNKYGNLVKVVDDECWFREERHIVYSLDRTGATGTRRYALPVKEFLEFYPNAEKEEL